MVIRERPDGRIELEFSQPGPYITISKAQWAELLARVKELAR